MNILKQSIIILISVSNFTCAGHFVESVYRLYNSPYQYSNKVIAEISIPFHDNVRYLKSLHNKFSKQIQIYREIKYMQDLLLDINTKYFLMSELDKKWITTVSLPNISQEEILTIYKRLKNIYIKLPLTSPINNAKISSHFGSRKHPITGKRTYHRGIDIYGNYFADICATADGIVVYAGYKPGYGKIVEILHASGVKTKYAHLSRIKVSSNMKVSRGDVLGKQGKTGSATNDHLHYEIEINKKSVNPFEFIKRHI